MYITYVKPHRSSFDYHNSFRPWNRMCNHDHSNAEENRVDFIPRVNVASDHEGYTLHFELPGMNKSDIKINFKENTLSVSGKRHIDGDEKTHWLRRERNAGTFERSIRFKKQVDGTKISALYANGMLTITVPYADGEQPKQITIN